MNIETQGHLADLRQSLAWRIHELQTELHALTMNREANASGGVVTDTKDAADAWQRSDVDAQTERAELIEWRRCQEALHRLDLGIYGDCCDCHEPIALSRLQVQPEAERCAACQSSFEQRMRAGEPRR
jgi:RNA polymerase-binding transcription factor DksA